MHSNLRLGAFIVTFNRPSRLKNSIQKILSQTKVPDSILIVDNGDSKQTLPVLEDFTDYPLFYHSFGDNLGPAGARAYALDRLMLEGFDWICWGDDDTPPQTNDAFERLLTLAYEEDKKTDVGCVGAVGCRFNWQKGEMQRLTDQELYGVVEVDSIGGGLQFIISRKAVERAGLPNEQLFFGYEELEYCIRIKQAGLRLLVDGDLMRIYREKAGRLNLSQKSTLISNNQYNTLWRKYYTTRNYIYMMHHIFHRPDLARREATKALARSLLSWPQGPRYGSQFTYLQLRGIFDGYYGNLGRTIVPKPKIYADSA